MPNLAWFTSRTKLWADSIMARLPDLELPGDTAPSPPHPLRTTPPALPTKPVIRPRRLLLTVDPRKILHLRASTACPDQSLFSCKTKQIHRVDRFAYCERRVFDSRSHERCNPSCQAFSLSCSSDVGDNPGFPDSRPHGCSEPVPSAAKEPRRAGSELHAEAALLVTPQPDVGKPARHAVHLADFLTRSFIQSAGSARWVLLIGVDHGFRDERQEFLPDDLEIVVDPRGCAVEWGALAGTGDQGLPEPYGAPGCVIGVQ